MWVALSLDDMRGGRSKGIKTRVEECSQQAQKQLKVQRRIKFESKRVSDRRKGEAEERPVEKLCHLSCCDSSGLTAHKSPSISQLCDMPSSLPLFIFIPDAYIRLPEAQAHCPSNTACVVPGVWKCPQGLLAPCLDDGKNAHARVC